MVMHLNGYSNFHDDNLDWLIDEMSTIHDEMEDIRKWKSDWEDILNDLNTKYIEIEAKYAMLEKSFNDFTSQVNSDFEKLSADFVQQFGILQANLEADIEGFKNEIQFQVNGLGTQVSALDHKLDQALDNLADSLKMNNPFTGREEPISQIIMQLAAFHMEDAITAGEYDNLNLTAQNYDNRNLTAYQYDVTAKQYLL